MELSAHELSLLSVAVPYAQEVKEKEDRVPERDELKSKLHCGSDAAQHIRMFLMETDAVKIASRLKRLPITAENKAAVQHALGDTSGGLVSHVLRENARLTRALAKVKHQKEAASGQLYQDVREEIDALKVIAKDELSELRKPIKDTALRVKAKETGLMLELNISDAHWGKLSWPSETGGAPYDLKIAEAMFMRALNVLLERAKGFTFERILFVLGNDFLHSNDVHGQTANGTKLDTEGRFQKTYWTARKTMCAVIERLREIAPVEVSVVYGNHDKTSVWTLADSLECFFNGDPRVKIDNQPIYRKYIHWGSCGLMLTHGDLGRRQDFPLLFATEKPEIFGNTVHREIHTGHLHMTKTEEFHGVRVRILPSLSPADTWHSENGFVGNLRNAEAYVWSKEEGLIAQFIYSDNAHSMIKTERKIA
jgi:hypothetical protein